ncbi:MAG: hypothetical protein Q9160_003333 [Pyrenula sp. 1 TL-2023]
MTAALTGYADFVSLLLSRTDAFFGNNRVFNQTVFDTTKAFWTEDTLDAKMLANENERLPTDLGWVKKTKAVTVDDLDNMSEAVENALSFLTDSSSNPSTPATTTRDLHGSVAIRF